MRLFDVGEANLLQLGDVLLKARQPLRQVALASDMAINFSSLLIYLFLLLFLLLAHIYPPSPFFHATYCDTVARKRLCHGLVCCLVLPSGFCLWRVHVVAGVVV